MRIAVPALVPAALADMPPHARVATLSGETMGTEWRVHLAVPPHWHEMPTNAAIRSRLDGLVAEMSHWEAGSLLSRFNRSAAGNWTPLPPDFASVVEAALNVASTTDGAFDPTLGALADLMGFGPAGPRSPPSVEAVATARSLCGFTRIDYDRPARRLRQPGGLRLDLSGIAKGYAVDAVSALLLKGGHRHHLVEIGGELAGRGIRPDGDPWWVDLETPPGPAVPPLRIALHEMAVATSGNYVRGEHTIDPRTGRPTANGVRSVSVLHRSAMLADAWASALTVIGPAGLALVEVEGLAVRMIDDAGEHLSDAMRLLLD